LALSRLPRGGLVPPSCVPKKGNEVFAAEGGVGIKWCLSIKHLYMQMDIESVGVPVCLADLPPGDPRDARTEAKMLGRHQFSRLKGARVSTAAH
jgi:hypothetical protein